jgi:hypothetical protein
MSFLWELNSALASRSHESVGTVNRCSPRPETDTRESFCADCGNPATGTKRGYWVRTGRQRHGTVLTAREREYSLLTGSEGGSMLLTGSQRK